MITYIVLENFSTDNFLHPTGDRSNEQDIELQNRFMLRRQKLFRIAADFLANEFRQFEWVLKVILFGSVASPLCKEVPRFSPYKRKRIEIWHECSDLDLAVWVNNTAELSLLRKARNKALATMRQQYSNCRGVAHHQAEIFIMEPQTNHYLGRLCTFNQCPKPDKRECRTTGCGSSAFLKVMDGFEFYSNALDNAVLLYDRKM